MSNEIATKTSFKPGESHIFWNGGCQDYWHRDARKITNCPEKLVVHHKDGNWKNNNLNNLDVISQSQHITIHNKQRTGIKKLSSKKYLLNTKIKELSKLGFSSRQIAKNLNIGKTTVLRSRMLTMKREVENE